MFSEAASTASLVVAQRRANAPALHRLVAQLRSAAPVCVATLGRGSSDNVATFARYLIERRTGCITTSTPPSITSLYEATLAFENMLVLAISQSGRSPDLIETAHHARRQGANVVALTNDAGSPLALGADCSLDIGAGPELSVAATKTVLLSLVAVLDIVAEWTDDISLRNALEHLPTLLEQAWALNWSAAVEPLIDAKSLFVIARGHALGIAQEIALKFKETCGLHAEAISAAEVRHGPMALVNAGFPVMILGQNDASSTGVAELARDFIGRGALVLHSGMDINQGIGLPHLEASPEISPILQLQSFYRLCDALARQRGTDPDAPPHLSKVTLTL
jgi:glucosamine--fructose-6-phosphate aminotransferase (isomerizing)